MNKDESRRTYVNILCSVGVLAVNLCISFRLSPYILRTIGVEANGYVSLAGSFVSMANLAVTALNAMAARFITIAWVRGDREQANRYYNSVFWGNLLILAALLAPAVWLIGNLERVIGVPQALAGDVKLLFSLVFASFFIRTGAPNWDCGTAVTNRMDLVYIPNMAAAVLRCLLLMLMFGLWTPRVWYVGFASLVTGLLTLGIAGFHTQRLTPGLRIRLKNPVCSRLAIRKLLGAGIWSAASSGGSMLLTGLDLLVCNVCMGPETMGILSLSRTLPGILVQLSESIRGAFGPELILHYARKDREGLLACLNRAMKLTAVVVTVPAAGLVVMSDAFYALWVPSQDGKLLQLLTALGIFHYLINSGTAVLLNVFPTVNRVKDNCAAMVVSGVCSLALTLLLVRFTDLDVYAVAGVSSLVTLGKNLLFTVPAAARLLGYPWHQFFPQLGITLACSCVVMAVGIALRLVLPVDSWAGFLLVCGMTGLISLWINGLIVLRRQERRQLLAQIRRKILKK